MFRHLLSLSLLILGIAIVAFSIFLFGQCLQITKGNLSADTLIAQTVLHDVIRQQAIRSPNGIKPQDLAGPLFTRVILYGLSGFVLICLAGWRRLGRRFGLNAEPPAQTNRSSEHP